MSGRRRRALALLSLLAVLAGLALGGQPASAISLIPGENVTTTGGVVQGSVALDQRSFKGIPFAAPPTGARRFAPPAAPASWTGERPARASGPACAQAFPVIGSLYPSSEDCLYLDVYTPPLSKSKNLPVMVWFYGGAYLLGSADQYDPTPLVTKGDVIVVQVNYRVGPFGFLTVPGSGANYGIQDQQAGLRWVRSNIAGFGGNPSNVTIFGESAGGNSVCQQLASPAAAGLFDRAIVQSGACGSALLDAGPRAGADRTGLAYARQLGCAGSGVGSGVGTPVGTDVLGCLRGKSKNELLATDSTKFDSMRIDFHPVVDGKTLRSSTGAAFAAGRFNKVPVLMGGQHDEGRLFVALFHHALKLGAVTAAQYDADVREVFGARAGAILAAYPAAAYGSNDLALSAVWTDGLFACNAASSLRSLAGRVPTYGYEFDDPKPPLSDADPLMPLRSYHGSDLWFLFAKSFGVPILHLDAGQQKLSEQMVGYWTTFARTGDPNGSGRPAWPLARTGNLLKLRTSGPVTSPLPAFSAEHDCTFWA